MRQADVVRNTLETQISVKLDLDGTGKATLATGIGFFDHMLDQVARHGMLDLEISARGEVSAALTFENPHAAAELRGKAGELQTALEQAGFDLSRTSLSFSSGGQGQQQGLFDQQQHNQTPVWRGRVSSARIATTHSRILRPIQSKR